MFDTILEIFSTHEHLLWWLGLGSLALLVGTALLIPWLIVLLPADFFARKLDPKTTAGEPRRVLALVLAVLRNLVGIVLFVAGVIMLFVPGQGLLTILVAVALVDFPGKNALLLRLVNSPRILNAANGIRRWAGKPEFHPVAQRVPGGENRGTSHRGERSMRGD